MAVIVANCPRCKSNNMTFDVMSQVETGIAYGWQTHFEVPCLCRNCCRTTVFAISQKEYSDEKFLAQNPPVKIQGSLNNYFSVEGFICLKDMGAMDAPEHVPEPIANAFREGATSAVTNCPNAAGAMFRLVIDLTTRPLLPREGTPGIKRKTRRDLGLRLPWLFENGRLPKELEGLSHCLREDGNDGAWYPDTQ
jgi:hypothetical protein